MCQACGVPTRFVGDCKHLGVLKITEDPYLRPREFRGPKGCMHTILQLDTRSHSLYDKLDTIHL